MAKMGAIETKFQLPKIKPVSLQKHLSKYYPNVDMLLVNFLSRIFVYDPTKRMTPEEALMDPFLTGEEYMMN